MANEGTTGLPINPLSAQASSATGVEFLEEQRNLQREMNELLSEHSDDLFREIEIYKNINRSLIDSVKHYRNLGKQITNNKELQKSALIELTAAAATDEQKRFAKQRLDSLKQEEKDLLKQKSLYERIFRSGIYPFVILLNRAFAVFKQLDLAGESFRKKMGMVRENSAIFETDIKRLSMELANVGVKSEDLVNAYAALGDEFGSINVLTTEMVKNTAVMKSQLGVSENITAGFLKNMGVIAQSSSDSQQNMMYLAAYMSQAAGVPLSGVMKDISSKTQTTLVMMSRIPSQVIKATVELRRMGTTLDKAAKSSHEILQFKESVNAEMEASVLLGRSINFQTARELAYRRDLLGSTQEILRIAKQVDFTNLDPFQQEAFARATGKTVDELNNLIQVDRDWNIARGSSDKQLKAMVDRYDKMMSASDLMKQSETERLKVMVQQKSNQATINQLTQSWNKIVMNIASTVLPTVALITDTLAGVIEDIAFGINKVQEYTDGWAGVLVIALYTVYKFRNILGGFFGVFDKLKGVASGVFGLFGGGVGGTNAVIQSVQTTTTAVEKTAGGITSTIKTIISNLSESFQILLTNISKGIGDVIENILTGFGKGLASLGTPAAMKGALTMILLGVAMIPFAYSLKLLSGIDFPAILAGAAALVVFTGAVFVLGMLLSSFGPVFAVGLLGLLGLGLALKPFAIVIKSVGEGMKTLGIGFTSVVDGLSKLADLSFVSTISSLKNLKSAITGVADALDKIPELKLNRLESIADKFVPAIKVSPATAKVEKMSEVTAEVARTTSESTNSNTDLLNNILIAINNLNKNLENGKIGLYVDGQLLSATLARQTEFRGGYGANVV